MASDSTLSPAIWLVCITPILLHARVAPLGTDVTAGPGSAQQGLLQTRQGTWGHSSSRDAGAQADTGSALGGVKPGSGSSSQGAGHPSVWSLVGLEPCPAPQYPVQPYPGSAHPRAEPILTGAQEERAVLGLRHIAGTCHPLPP